MRPLRGRTRAGLRAPAARGSGTGTGRQGHTRMGTLLCSAQAWERKEAQLPSPRAGDQERAQRCQLAGRSRSPCPCHAALCLLRRACWSTEEFARPTFDDISTELRQACCRAPACPQPAALVLLRPAVPWALGHVGHVCMPCPPPPLPLVNRWHHSPAPLFVRTLIDPRARAPSLLPWLQGPA